MVDPIAFKTVVIDGKEHTIKVMPPGPEEHDETVWRRPRAGAHIQLQRRIALADGTPTVVTTLADQPKG